MVLIYLYTTRLSRTEVSLSRTGSNASQFAKEYLAPLITVETQVYQEIENVLFKDID